MNAYDIANVIRDRMSTQRRIKYRSIQAGETHGKAWIRFVTDEGTVTFVEADET